MRAAKSEKVTMTLTPPLIVNPAAWKKSRTSAQSEYLAFVLPSFWAICDETPSPNEIVAEKAGAKPGQQIATKSGNELVAI